MQKAPRLTRSAVATLGAIFLGGLIVRGSAVIALLATASTGMMVLVVLVRLLTTSLDDPEERRRVLWWTLVTFGIHLFLGLVVTNLASPFNFLRSDSGTYHAGATALVKHWSHGGPTPIFPGGKEGYFYTLGILYFVFGLHTAAGLALNATLAAAVIPVLFDATTRQFGHRAARHVPPLVAVLPGLVMWTSPLLKEAGVVFLVAVAANCAIRLSHAPSPGALVGLAISLAVLFTYRGPIAILAAAGLVVGIMAAHGRVASGLGAGLSAAAAIAVFVLAFGLGITGYRSALKQSNLQQVGTVRQDLAGSAKSGFDSGADVSTTGGALSYAPKGILNFLLGPAPWQLRSATQAAALPDVFVWWYLFPSLLRGVRTAWRRVGGGISVLAIPAVLMIFVLAIVSGNFGLVVRERSQVVVLLLPLIAVGLAERATRRDVGPRGTYSLVS
ncbi:MAG: hypothetical protein ACR2HY_04015 [Acidimicrobiales bacterium]